jgi:hypothetical protein
MNKFKNSKKEINSDFDKFRYRIVVRHFGTCLGNTDLQKLNQNPICLHL